MAGLVKVPINNQGGFAGVSVPAIGGAFTRLPTERLKYGETVRTDVNGNRRLANNGYALESDCTMHTGQGVYFDGTQHYNTRFIPDLTQDFTLLLIKEAVLTGGNNGCYSSPTDRFEFTVRDKVYVDINESSIALDTVLVVGSLPTIAITYDAATKIVTVTNLNNGDYKSATITSTIVSLPLFIGARNNNGIEDSYTTGVQKDFYYIPQKLEAHELARHFQLPEHTVFKHGKFLKTTFLQKETIDKIVAGYGVWYPLSENNRAWSTVTNLFASNPVAINENTEFNDGEIGYSVSSGLWSFEDGKAIFPESNEYSSLNSLKLLVANKSYIVDIDIGTLTGIVKLIGSGFGALQIINQAGLFRYVITPSSGTKLGLARNSGAVSSSMTINSFSIYEVNDSNMSVIENFNNSAFRSNAKQLKVGCQNALIKQNKVGLCESLSSRGELMFDNKSFIDLHNKKITGDWYLDMFVSVQESLNSNSSDFFTAQCYDNASTSIGDFKIFYDANNSTLKVKFVSQFQTIPGDKVVVSLDFVSGVAKVRATGISREFLDTLDSINLESLGGVNDNVAGKCSFSLSSGVRTGAERAMTVGRIKAIHGVS